MSMIPEVKCRRCGEAFSSLRSRCPNCGTRRVTQSGRTPSTTPGTVKGTASYERAETNTKWQMIFGLILVVAVVLAVIVMVSTSLDGSDQPSNPVVTVPTVTDYVPVVESAPTPSPTPTPSAESVRIMFYNTEISTDFLMHEGDEPIPLTASVLPATLENPVVTWTCSDTTGEYCVVTTTGDTTCEVSIVKAIAGGVKLTATCGGASKEITVYLVE